MTRIDGYRIFEHLVTEQMTVFQEHLIIFMILQCIGESDGVLEKE